MVALSTAPTEPAQSHLSGTYSVAQAARRLKVRDDAVKALYAAGQLHGVYVGRRLRLSREWVDALAPEPATPPMPAGPTVAEVARVLATGLRALADELEGLGR